jgi:uncharacterized protein
VPDVLTLKVQHFEVTAWAKDIAQAQTQLDKTHKARGAPLPTSILRFTPALTVISVDPAGPLALSGIPISELALPTPVFFENKQYEFEFLFSADVDLTAAPTVIHRLQSVENGFHFKGRSLRGSLNFGNNVGWFRIGVRYRIGEKEVTQSIALEVFPTKMALTSDLNRIYQAVDECYPLWRFSFVQKTEQELAKSRKPHERFELLWLAHFESLRKDLLKAVQQICRSPHTRLLPREHHVRAERLRGRLPTKLEQSVAQHFCNGETLHQYRISKKRLSLDTPENQFVKMVLIKCTRDITRFITRVRQLNQAPENTRISESFFSDLEGWKGPLEQLLSRPFFVEVGLFDGMAVESLVLHQRAGYSALYRIWQELKLYLGVLGSNTSMSMKSVAELYEVWCLLEVRRILLGLGFTESAKRSALISTKGLERSLVEGIGAAFHLQKEGITIRLAHEPRFSSSKDPVFGKIYTWTTTQKPDIFLEATFSDGEKVQWIFDAKYRIADDDGGIDLAPDEAINQMHRYRDALIYIHQADDGEMEMRRPILGAFVLFPGWFDEDFGENPYGEAIEAVGIGGFPLLPDRPNKWLTDFFEARFGGVHSSSMAPNPDRYLIEDSARIATLGMYLQRYKNLTMAASINSFVDRDEQYKQRFLEGSAGWYHLPLKTANKKSTMRNVMREVQYCAIAVPRFGVGQVITHLYTVKSVRLVRRCDITIEQAGKLDLDNNAEYWLFELGFPQPLSGPVYSSEILFRLRFTDAATFLQSTNQDALPERYTFFE